MIVLVRSIYLVIVLVRFGIRGSFEEHSLVREIKLENMGVIERYEG